MAKVQTVALIAALDAHRRYMDLPLEADLAAVAAADLDMRATFKALSARERDDYVLATEDTQVPTAAIEAAVLHLYRQLAGRSRRVTRLPNGDYTVELFGRADTTVPYHTTAPQSLAMLIEDLDSLPNLERVP